MKSKIKTLIICLIIPLAVGGLSALLTKDSMISFEYLNKPPLSPPAWLFPLVWTVLYLAMGAASYLVIMKNISSPGLVFYGIQLVFNFFWTILFFNADRYLAAFIWIILLWVLILTTLIYFFRESKAAGYLMLPYLLWVSFAAYLNYGIYFLN